MLKAPKRTPYWRKLARAVWSSALTSLDDRVAAKHAERLDHAEGEAAGKPGEIRSFAQRDERRELGVELGGEPSLDAAQDLLALDGTKMLVGRKAGSSA